MGKLHSLKLKYLLKVKDLRAKWSQLSEIKKAFITLGLMVIGFSLLGIISWRYNNLQTFSTVVSIASNIMIASIGLVSLYIALKRFIYEKRHLVHAKNQYDIEGDRHDGSLENITLRVFNYGKNPIFVGSYSYLVIEHPAPNYEEDYLIRQKYVSAEDIIESCEVEEYNLEPNFLGIRPLNVTYRNSEADMENESIMGNTEWFDESLHPTLRKLFKYSAYYIFKNDSNTLIRDREGFVMGLGVYEEDIENKTAEEIWRESEYENLDFEELTQRHTI